jgi:hypothetical protein
VEWLGVISTGKIDMKRTIDEWKNCDPKAMAYGQSDAAVMFAFQDAKADVIELHAENLRLRNIARAIAYPQRGTPEEAYSLMDFAKLLQSAYTADRLWVPEEDR